MERFESMAEKESSAVQRREGREVLENTNPTQLESDGKLSEEQLASLRKRYESFYTVLDGIDFSYLRKEYEDIARKSGINPDTLNFLEPDRILPYSSRRRRSGVMLGGYTRGAYDIESNVSSIDWGLLESAHADEGRAWLLPFHLLKALTHEEAHAVSKGVCSDSMSDDEIVQIRRTGYEDRKRVYELTKDEEGGEEYFEERVVELNFRAFNEGVVEKLSQEVLTRYVQNANDKNFDAETAKRFLAWHEENPQLKSYQDEVLLVESFVSFIAAAANVPESIAWQGVVRGLFEGDAFDTPEIRAAFSEAAGFDLVENLNNVSRYTQKEIETLRADIQKRAAFIKNLEEGSPLKQMLLQSIDRLNIFRRK